jgi:hypothetical protein
LQRCDSLLHLDEPELVVGRVESGDVVCRGVSGKVEAVVHEEGFDFRLERDGLLGVELCARLLQSRECSCVYECVEVAASSICSPLCEHDEDLGIAGFLPTV